MYNEPRKRICFCLQVKRGRLAEYRARHAAVWPEMLEALRQAGWYNYSLFLREDGLLIGYLETPDFDRALQQITATEINRTWQAQMTEFFDGVPWPQGRRADGADFRDLPPAVTHSNGISQHPGSKITALMPDWPVEDSIVGPGSQGFGVRGSFSRRALASPFRSPTTKTRFSSRRPCDVTWSYA